jgi:hypothetical protein
MFVVTEADAAAIRDVFNQEGDLSAAIELPRRFPGITDNAEARACARTIAGWTPLPEQPRPVTLLCSWTHLVDPSDTSSPWSVTEHSRRQIVGITSGPNQII